MVCTKDFYEGEELEAILEAIDEKIQHKDDQFRVDVDGLVRELEVEPPKADVNVKNARNFGSLNKVFLNIKIGNALISI